MTSKEVGIRKTVLTELMVTHPNGSKAFIDIWFTKNHVVIGGHGWLEYNDYEKLAGEGKIKP